MEIRSNLYFDFEKGEFINSESSKIVKAQKIFLDIKSIFLNPNDEKITDDTVLYEVNAFINEANIGELNFGVTKIHSGTINGEFFMTKGHYHEKLTHTEYYWGINGKGLLLLLNKNGECSIELVEKNSLHYIPKDTAHRLVNTSEEELVVGACWPSDAGHDYEEIQEKGFPIRIIQDGTEYKIEKNKI